MKSQNKPKSFLLVLILAVYIILCSCGQGNVSQVTVTPVDSAIYTQEDIDAAINVTLDFFKKEFTGSSLKEIHYAGDEYLEDQYSPETYGDYDELIALLSTYHIDSSDDGILEPGSTVTEWSWILCRRNGGQWVFIDCGYC
ncbi:MAG: hypothetical protein IJH40_06430 [Ruminococcus sp.]|uniref:hypothetical protein n=1 Tax=Ruminococcus sp. TaxID=41978 RepID=UPI002872DC51|nr:hypothetical protein [Ruminococcus sp.]MBQ3285263.1 hypothetical protein [Ruminococcus sp.]